MKTCPICGFKGAMPNCPNDGAALLTPDELEARGGPDPTQAPATSARRDHATAAGPSDDQLLRGENYGEWAEPEIVKREDPMLGRVIGGRYEVTGLLGKGGMGAVYKAYQPAVQRKIALKVLLSEFAENETVIRRFHQEALAASRLTHPNTISVYDFGQSADGILYIAMEMLVGESLAEALRGGHIMTPRRAIHIMRQVCKSLQEAHDAGIIHRDLKPDNIFLTDIERDFVKVLDFGVAKLKEFEGKEGTLTQAGMIFGTPKYMSPEQARSGDLDRRSDIYALGVILYEMMCGRPPFVADNPLSILIAHVNETPKPPSVVRPDLEILPPLEAIIMKALSKDRTLRQASAEELGIELEAINDLLDGVPYEQVASRLPNAGRTGQDPSVIGQAIMPQASDDTVHGASSGDTVQLGGAPVPLEPTTQTPTPIGLGELVLDDHEPAPQKKSLMPWVLGLAVPGLAAAAWFALAPASAPPAAPDVGVVATAQPPSVAPDAALAAAAEDAAIVAEKEPDAAADAVPVEFMLSSVPSKARIIDARNGEKVGVTYTRLTVKTKRTFILKRSGYEDQWVTLDPDDEERNKKFELKALPEAAKPRPRSRPKREPVTVRKVPTADPSVRVTQPATKPKPKPKGDPIEFE